MDTDVYRILPIMGPEAISGASCTSLGLWLSIVSSFVCIASKLIALAMQQLLYIDKVDLDTHLCTMPCLKFNMPNLCHTEMLNAD